MNENVLLDGENDCELSELDRGPKMTTLTGRMTGNSQNWTGSKNGFTGTNVHTPYSQSSAGDLRVQLY